MKHLVVASVVFVSALAVSGCGTDVDLGSRPQYATGSNTLTLFVYDGQSGAAISDATVTLQIGSSVETATVVNNTYTISGIPGGTFPITVARDGYLPYTSAAVTFAAGTAVTAATTVPGTYLYSVGMYPQQSVTADIIVKVYDQVSGAPITNGSVIGILNSTKTIASNAGIGATTGAVKPLPGSVGFLPTAVTAQITNGTATLAHDKLVYGAWYDLIVVSATNAQGQFVEPNADASAVAGQTSNSELVLFVGGPAVTPTALTASNEDSSQITPALDVTFPYPVQTCTDASTWSWTNNNGPTNTAKPPTTGAKVTISFPSTNVMRVTPVIDEATVTAGQGLTLTFSGISVQVAGSTKCTGLGLVTLRGTSEKVSLTIIQSPPST